jgi:hypothetical protein
VPRSRLRNGSRCRAPRCPRRPPAKPGGGNGIRVLRRCCGGGGRKDGQVLELGTIARFDDCRSCGPGRGIAGEGEGDRDARGEGTASGMHLWARCEMVEMRGDSAHLFVLKARSWSNVGSELRWRRNSCQLAIYGMEWRNRIANVLHEPERRAGTPG